MSSVSQFLNARDYLLAHRSDYETALHGFSWPRMERFNWALDYFDGMARNTPGPALLIVEEDGAQTTRTFAELASRSNQAANLLRDLDVRRGDPILMMLGNQSALWEVLLAGMKLGAVLIPAAPLLATEDLRDRLKRGNVRHVIAAAGQTAKFESLTGSYTRISVGGVATDGNPSRTQPAIPTRSQRTGPLRQMILFCSTSLPEPRRNPNW